MFTRRVMRVEMGGLPLSVRNISTSYTGSSSKLRMEAGDSTPVVAFRLKAVVGVAGRYTYAQVTEEQGGGRQVQGMEGRK